jgi:protein ImuB
VLDKLMRNTCRRMERASLGARQLDLVFERVDNSVQTIRIGTAQPSHDANHLTRLLRERFEQVDPGAGVEAMRPHPHNGRATWHRSAGLSDQCPCEDR